ncbi:unnamed protein product [Plutella xylostella]|uniref:Mannosyl-oligosaccharide glucosidase n=1 Tax=Plutella xylostella TaxID=51655 RepID=A0A8S4G7M7_PLUXY|nr:unnamed protein product [Plutella xylostella]
MFYTLFMIIQMMMGTNIWKLGPSPIEMSVTSLKRHWCDQADNLASYGWVRHDGVHFGEQVIEDSPHTLTTSFIKTLGGEYGGHWTARIDVKSEGNASHPFTLIWYAALDESLGPAAPHSRLWMEGGALMGHTPQLNNFRMTLVPKAPFTLIWYAALDESLGPAAPHSRLWMEGGALMGHTPQLNNFRMTLVPKAPFTLIWYAALDESLGPAAPHSRLWMEGGALMGHTPQLNNFRMTLVPKGLCLPVQWMGMTGFASAPFTLIWYAALDESLGPAAPHSRLWMEGGALMGHTPQLNNFRMTLVPKGKLVHTSYSEANAAGLHVLKEKVYSLLRVERHPELGRHAVLAPDHELKDHEKDVNFVAIQLLVNTPFTLDVVYTTEDLPTPPLKGDSYTEALEEKRQTFDEQFEETFKLAEKGYSSENISIARAAFSNCLGGVGYFYGAGRVQSSYTKEPVPYWKAPLYTAVPSRSFFPRGFLWDEGFHGLLLGRWSPELQLDVAAHWLDLINVEGWIPREQILGESRVNPGLDTCKAMEQDLGKIVVKPGIRRWGVGGLLLGRWSPELQLDVAAHWLDLINVEGWIPREQILGESVANPGLDNSEPR